MESRVLFFCFLSLLLGPLPSHAERNNLESRDVAPGTPVDAGTELRILPLGDSITWGFASPDGNGYRLRLFNDLSGDDVVMAGTQHNGNMQDYWNEGYPGKTIEFIANACGAALAQNPNIVLLMAGTNDMNPDASISTEGSDPNAAAQRLSNLVDQIFENVPNTVVLVAKIPQVRDSRQESNTEKFNALIPGMVSDRANHGQHVALVDMSFITPVSINSSLFDGVHPNEAAYQSMGDTWYQAIHNIPQGWIQPPVGPDPDHPYNCDPSNGGSGSGGGNSGSGEGGGGSSGGGGGSRGGVDSNANGGPDPSIPPPVFHHDKLQCEIALGVGHPGDWNYKKNWVAGGKIADGLHLDMPGVQLFDMDGDVRTGVNETSGLLVCWKNNWPDPWAPCGSNNGIIASGAGPRDQVFFGYMKGDSKADYLVVNGDTGAVTVYWNEGPDNSADNGWRFNPGGVIATGVPHANLQTLRFADMNGDGRTDYVVAGKGGSLNLYLNTGLQGSYDILFVNAGGIATGADDDLTTLILSDVTGDGRADYMIWDQQAGLSGFLNIRTRDEGTPFFAQQGGAKYIADGITQNPDSIRLADIDGDGLNDYCYIDDVGALWIWWNRGTADTSTGGDGVRLHDLDGDGVDDYVYLDYATGQPYAYLNAGPNPSYPDGWQFNAFNGGKPIASGACPRDQVHWGDIDGDKRADYLCLNDKTGEVVAYLNGGPDPTADNGWRFNPVGSIASGLGPGKNSRFADVDGDLIDYIELSKGGKTNIWKNNHPDPWSPMDDANASGIGRPPAEITFANINNDGKADYIWTDPLSGQPHVWCNHYPSQPVWLACDYPNVRGEGMAGANVLYAKVQNRTGAQAVFVNPDNGAIAASHDGC
ncbi:carbohydrate esterase family 3 protein, partial [Zasmidium cellare ATCC 36951]